MLLELQILLDDPVSTTRLRELRLQQEQLVQRFRHGTESDRSEVLEKEVPRFVSLWRSVLGDLGYRGDVEDYSRGEKTLPADWPKPEEPCSVWKFWRVFSGSCRGS